MKIFSFAVTLIVINNLILCSYDLYENQISIYFKKSPNRKNTAKEFGDETINNLFYNNIFSHIKFGKNKKDVFLYLTYNNSNIKLISSLSNAKTKDKDIFFLQRAKTEINLNYLSDNSDTSKNENKSYLGLSLYDNEQNEFSFINQMKENKIINRRIFSVLYKDKSITDDPMFDGQILFGLYPHELTSRYDDKNLKWVQTKDNTWKINFDTIEFNNEEKLDINDVEFDIGLNLMVGPEEYRIKIYENFLKKNIDKNICKEEIFFNKKDNQFYLAYSCIYDLDLENFPTLSFFNKELNYSIVMDSRQLLCVYKGIVYLKVVFKKKAENKKWIFGRSFMELYPLVFDVDNKRIGFYKVEISNDHPFILFLFIVGIFAIIFITVYRGRQMLKKENEQKENERKENIRNDIRGIKENSKNNDTNINNEKSKLKND